MAILPVTQYGDSILNKKTGPVTKIDLSIIELVSNMFDTMENADGVGLAANQVGSNKSIFVIDVTDVKGCEPYGKMVFINPKITYRSPETVILEEGCLSLPTLRAEVSRPKEIKIVYQDFELKNQEFEADGFIARVIQHEYDHLQGIYFVDKVEDFRRKELKDELIRVKNRQIDCDYPVTPKPKVKK